ncbi:hypothetical protein EMCRGX_G002789 [Ephydatia muelleri]
MKDGKGDTRPVHISQHASHEWYPWLHDCLSCSKGNVHFMSSMLTTKEIDELTLIQVIITPTNAYQELIELLCGLLEKDPAMRLGSTVMMLLAVMDPEGTRQRKMHRLQRRTYENMDPPKRIKSKNDSTVFQKKVMEYLNQQSKSSSTDAATKEPILTREKLINKYQACTSAKRRSSDRDQRSTEESLFGMKVCQMEKTRNKTYKRIGDCLRVSGFRSTDTYKDTLQKATSSFDDAAQADAGTLIISMGRVANCPLQNGKPWTLGGYLDELGGSRRITIGVYLPNDTSSDEQSSGTPQQGRAVYKASYHFKVINCTPMFPKISFAQKGSGGNLVTGCTHQAKSGTKVALACLGCDQTCHYHDAVMGLTWLVRVEARRVPPAIDV